jgi:hypothetical protein
MCAAVVAQSSGATRQNGMGGAPAIERSSNHEDHEDICDLRVFRVFVA